MNIYSSMQCIAFLKEIYWVKLSFVILFNVLNTVTIKIKVETVILKLKFTVVEVSAMPASQEARSVD